MDPVDTQSLLLQMRSLAAQANSTPEDLNGAQKLPGVEKSESFADLLANSVKAVNEQQQKSAEMKKAFEQGDPDMELSEVMLQAQKASLSFQAMTQVRNKLVEAYKEVINMPL